MIINRWITEEVDNYGDALNNYLWPRLLNPKIQEIPGTFYGIGSVLLDTMPETPKKIVFGAGIGYGNPPKVDASWDIRFVRGPVTSSKIPGSKYLTDPGIFMAKFFKKLIPSYQCSFLPRWQSWSPRMVKDCAQAGINVISPMAPVEHVTTEIAKSKLLLTEALHGAVVADALRVPWISIYGDRGHEFKWYDWTGSMDIIWNPIDMAEFTLSWARDNAVPQLSALSTHNSRLFTIDEALYRLNKDIDTMEEVYNESLSC